MSEKNGAKNRIIFDMSYTINTIIHQKANKE